MAGVNNKSAQPAALARNEPPRREDTAQAEVKGLRELVDLYRERLTDADWRYQELLEQLKILTNALPAPAEPAAPRPKCRWWPSR